MSQRLSALFALFLIVSCNRSTDKGSHVVVEPYFPSAGSVVVDIDPLPVTDGSFEAIASYRSRGKIAKFRLEFGLARDIQSKDSKEFSFKVGEGRFVAISGSDAGALLIDLKKALEAKKLPTNARRSSNLPFTFANLGDNLSQDKDGAYSETPAGHWTATKLFLGTAGHESEVFFNFNPAIKKAEFVIKDPDYYGDLVLAELAKVL